MSKFRRGAGYSSSSSQAYDVASPGTYAGQAENRFPIPNLPGNKVYNPKDWQRPKQQRCTVFGGTPGVFDSKFDRVAETGIASTLDRPKPDAVPPTSKTATKDDYERIYPPWVVFDRMVLRFHAYFQEDVSESPLENARFRRCTILFYLEDGTLQIIEPREDNSGIPQGSFLRRHRVPKGRSPDRFIEFTDLNVGGEVTVYQRTFHIHACDDATRGFLEREGVQVPEDGEPPEDQYHARLKEKESMRTAARGFRAQMRLMEKEQDYRWLVLDKKVLRFYCSWDDRKSLFGDKLPFILHYFLSDDTVEVAEVQLRNSGRDPYPLLLKRGRLPKYLYSIGARPMSAGTRERANFQYYHWKDLGVGKSVYVYGREMKIFDCDEFTRNWYKERLGIDMPSKEVKFERKPKTREPEIPPDALGIGREEDTRQNCLSLIPKPPKPNWHQFQNSGGQTMRFYAWMVEDPEQGFTYGHESDRDRRFIVSYHLMDDTVSIFEPPRRNSGIVSGKYLERGVLRKPGSRTVKYMARDFYEGARLIVHSRLFELGEPDLFTMNYQENRRDMFPMCDYHRVITRISDEIHSQDLTEELKSALIDVDDNGDGVVEKHLLVAAMRHVGVELAQAEATAISKRLDQNARVVPILDLLGELGCTAQEEPCTAREFQQPEESQHLDSWRPSDRRRSSHRSPPPSDRRQSSQESPPGEPAHSAWGSSTQGTASPRENLYKSQRSAFPPEPDSESMPVAGTVNRRNSLQSSESLYDQGSRRSSRCGSFGSTGNRRNASHGLW